MKKEKEIPKLITVRNLIIFLLENVDLDSTVILKDHKTGKVLENVDICTQRSESLGTLH